VTRTHIALRALQSKTFFKHGMPFHKLLDQ